jgi:hypothetical protein
MPGRYRFSMPSNRDRTDPWFRIGSLDVTTTVLIAALSVVSFFLYAASKTAFAKFILIPDDVIHGQVWRVVTWPLANEPSIWQVITIAIFWWFGSQVEAQLGRVHNLWMVALTVIVPGIIAALTDVPIWDLRTLEIAIFVIFVLERPTMPFFFGIPAWVLAVVFVGIDVLQLLADRLMERLLVYLAALVIALLTARAFGMLDEMQWIPKIPLKKRRRKAKRSGRGQVVVDGPWSSSPPTYTPMQDQAEVDRILDRISQVGMQGLTADEKRRLNEASKRLRKQGH